MNHKYFDPVRDDIEKEMQQHCRTVGIIPLSHSRQHMWIRSQNEEGQKQIRVFITKQNQSITFNTLNN